MAESGTRDRLGQLLVNIDKVRSTLEGFRSSDPLLGADWKAGMIRYWEEKLEEALERATTYLRELGVDPDVILNDVS